MKLELQLPSNLQSALSARARAHSRSVEDEARLLLETALEPPNSASEREQLTVLDDAELWRLASQTVSTAESEQMQRLTERQKTVGLPAEASGELERLQKYAERVMLLRAEAATLLKRRGHDTLSIRSGRQGLRLEAWRIVTPILEAWKEGKVPMQEHTAGSAFEPKGSF